MTINGILQTENAASNEKNAAKIAPRSGDYGFDKLFTAIERGEQNRDAFRQPENTKITDDRARPIKSKTEPKPASRAPSEKNETVDDGSAVQNVYSQSQERITEPSAQEKSSAAPETLKELVERVSEILQVPVETVLAWLAALELQPEILTDTKAVVALLGQALEAQNPAELLIRPEFPALYEAVNEAVEELLQQSNAAQEKVLIPELPNLRVETDGANETVVVTEIVESAPESEEAKLLPLNENELQSAGTEARREPNASDGAQRTSAQPEVREAAEPNETGAAAHQGPQNENALFTQRDDAFIPVIQLETAGAERAAQTAQTQQLSSGPNVNASDIINQIMSRVRTYAAENFSEIRLTLRPESLGDVTLRVMTQNGIVTALFVAESQRVKEALESNFNQLRDSLQEQGVNVADLSVMVGRGNDYEERMAQFARMQQNSRNRMRRIANRAAETQATGDEDRSANAADLMTGLIDVTA